MSKGLQIEGKNPNNAVCIIPDSNDVIIKVWNGETYTQTVLNGSTLLHIADWVYENYGDPLDEGSE